jgi:hypothetical protein
MRRELPSDPLLLLRESGELSPPAEAATRVASRLAASVVASAGSSAPGALATPKSSGGTAKVLAERFVRWSLVPLGVGVALGAGGQALRGGGELHPQPPLPVATVAPVVMGSPAAVGAAPSAEPPVELPLAPAAPSAMAKSTLVAERALLDRARKQLSAGAPTKALAFLEQHAQLFPHGQLGEEREAMWINVLALSGRSTEATARGAAFAVRFPNSLMGSSVRAALRKVENEQ